MAWTRELVLEDCRWVSGEPVAAGTYLVRTRHTGTLVRAHVEPGSDATCLVTYDEPMRTVAPGQSAVIYDERQCFGGGIITKA